VLTRGRISNPLFAALLLSFFHVQALFGLFRVFLAVCSISTWVICVGKFSFYPLARVTGCFWSQATASDAIHRTSVEPSLTFFASISLTDLIDSLRVFFLVNLFLILFPLVPNLPSFLGFALRFSCIFSDELTRFLFWFRGLFSLYLPQVLEFQPF